MQRFIRAALILFPFALAAQTPEPITVSLMPATPKPGAGLRWSPKGETVPLTFKADTFTGSFTLGPAGSRPIAVKLAKGPGQPHFNTLWLDVNRDGKLTSGEKLTVVAKDTRGKWWSTFDTIIDVPVPAEDGHPATTRPYPLSLWYVEDPQESDIAPALRWSRRGWHIGRVDVGGKPAYVLMTEMEMDGKFDQRDAWALSRYPDSILRSDVHTLENHVWLDGVAYRPVKIDEHGRSLSFVQTPTTTTEAEEKINNDPYFPDRGVARAPTPVPFAKELGPVLAQAKRENKRVLVDFEAVWCGPCHTMDQLVYTAQSVVTAAKGVIAVKVDGDDHHDLKLRYKVNGYPTMILLDSNGTEIRRADGYQGVLEMVALLKP